MACRRDAGRRPRWEGKGEGAAPGKGVGGEKLRKSRGSGSWPDREFLAVVKPVGTRVSE